MKSLPFFFFKMSLFLCLLCSSIPTWISAQPSTFPSLIALSREVGFIIDSTELREHNFSTIAPGDSFRYRAIIQKGVGEYEVVNINKNGNREVAKIGSNLLRSEWQKVRAYSVDTNRINDYATAQLLFPEAIGFLELDSSFHLIPYYYEAGNSKNHFRMIAELMGKYASILDKIEIGAFQLDVSGIYNRMLISARWCIGASYNNEVLDAYVSTGDELNYKYRELSLTSGYVITNKSMMLAFSGGISAVRYRIIEKKNTSNTILFPHFSETEIQKTDEIGFPVCLDFSFPARTGLGLSLKTQATFIPDSKTYFSIGGGIRLGRTKQKRN